MTKPKQKAKSNIERLLTKAAALYYKKQDQPAMTIAKKVLEKNRENEEALFYVAHGLYHAGQFRKSLQFWKRLKKNAPEERHVSLNMGACHEDLGETSLALANYKRELKLYPTCLKALYNLGALYRRIHKYRLATIYLERCYFRHYRVQSVFGKLAFCYFKTGQREKEQRLYEDFLRSHPNDTWALNNLGSHLMDEGKYYRALLHLRKAARLAPSDKLVAKNIRKIEHLLQKQRDLSAN
jgi:tetratricopeptide (TPR) repeat protein